MFNNGVHRFAIDRAREGKKDNRGEIQSSSKGDITFFAGKEQTFKQGLDRGKEGKKKTKSTKHQNTEDGGGEKFLSRKIALSRNLSRSLPRVSW